jgi:hypothetical protein
VATAEANAVQVAEQAQSNISVTISQETEVFATETTQNASPQSNFTFGSLDNMFEEVTLEMMVDPTITVAEISVSIQSPVEQAAQEEQTVDFQMESSAPQMDTGFAEQQNQSFSTGQSITAVLNNVAPNFSQFDVAPPSAQEQQTTARAESQANNMSDEQLASNLDEFADELQDSGGFTDQSITIFLMGRVNGFDNYGGQLQDNPFYNDGGLPVSRVQNDRNIMMQLIGTDRKHEELISLQYGR